jgi:hypothetical protein
MTSLFSRLTFGGLQARCLRSRCASHNVPDVFVGRILALVLVVLTLAACQMADGSRGSGSSSPSKPDVRPSSAADVIRHVLTSFGGYPRYRAPWSFPRLRES